jgi:hypothetical protein
MRVIVFVKATAENEAGAMPPPELFKAMTAYKEALVAAGIMQDGEGLYDSSKGKRIAFDGASRTVIDGPFAAVNELVAGFWLWQMKDMDEAVALANRITSASGRRHASKCSFEMSAPICILSHLFSCSLLVCGPKARVSVQASWKRREMITL